MNALRLGVAIACPVLVLARYSGVGYSGWGETLLLLVATVGGVGAVVLDRYDRAAQRLDEPTTLHLNNG